MTSQSNLRGEAPLSELFADPVMQTIMAYDGVSERQLEAVIANARKVLEARSAPCLSVVQDSLEVRLPPAA